MHQVKLDSEDDFDGWRQAARALAGARVAATDIVWTVRDEQIDLLALAAPSLPVPPATAFNVSKSFINLAGTAILHSDKERFSLLYLLLLRLRDSPRAMEDAADPVVQRLERMAKSVRRDIHKMHAFLRFREVATPEGAHYVAWFEPEHHIVRSVSGFFARRFANMRWTILTPSLSLHWDGEIIREGPGAVRQDAPDEDPVEAVWKTYYASIFNPARVKVGAMLKEMPKKYWKNMPETALVGEMIKTAQNRELEMVAASKGLEDSAAYSPPVKSPPAAPAPAPAVGDNLAKSWEKLRVEARACTRCHLYRNATQTVFGEGPLNARIMFVGEQPGDQEDLAGRPFVGPAGQLFDRALREAGVDRAQTYVTNAVKHFKFEQRGKRRIHSKPDTAEIDACRWWLDQERDLVRPSLIVALGVTAARALFGKAVTITKMRGQPHRLGDDASAQAWVTVHPSFLLRIPEEERRRSEYAAFVADLGRFGEIAQAMAS